MILLSEHKILFLKPHTVAGTSFEIALLTYAGENDIITRVVDEDDIAQRAVEAIIKAVKEGKIAEEEIINSYNKIRKLKEDYGIY